MNSLSRIVLGIVLVAVLMMIFPIVLSSTHDLQVDNYTQTANVTASGGSGSMVLDEELWDDEVSAVISVSATGQTLAADSYASATQTLTVTGYSANTSYDTTAVYEYDALTDYTGMGSMVAMTPLLLWIAAFAAVIGILWYSIKSFRS